MEAGYDMERQKELQVNTTKIAKMKKTAHKGVMVNAKHKHEKKAIAKQGRVCKIQKQPRGGKGTIKLTSYGQMNYHRLVA